MFKIRQNIEKTIVSQVSRCRYKAATLISNTMLNLVARKICQSSQKRLSLQTVFDYNPLHDLKKKEPASLKRKKKKKKKKRNKRQ